MTAQDIHKPSESGQEQQCLSRVSLDVLHDQTEKLMTLSTNILNAAVSLMFPISIFFLLLFITCIITLVL